MFSSKDSINLKINNENTDLTSNSLNKIQNTNFERNNSNGQNNFSNDRNMNFVLDNLIEQLDLSEKGWTEKLVMRVEKALSDGSEEIELFLKPKELGSLKINLNINKSNAKVIFKAENLFAIQCLQQNELLLTKLFGDQGINLEKTHYDNGNFLMNQEQSLNSNSGKNQKNNKRHNESGTIISNNSDNVLEEVKGNKSDYIINVKA